MSGHLESDEDLIAAFDEKDRGAVLDAKEMVDAEIEALSAKMKKPRVKRVKKAIKPNGPHDWIYWPTKVLTESGSVDLAQQAFNLVIERLKELASSPEGLVVTKLGPGVVTVRVEDAETAAAVSHKPIEADTVSPAYRRIALTGDERMTIKGCYVGKTAGVVVEMVASAGQILGVSKDVVCEARLAEFADSYLIQGLDPASPRQQINERLADIAADFPAFKASIGAEMERRERLAREVAEIKKQEEVKQQAEVYTGTAWGAW